MLVSSQHAVLVLQPLKQHQVSAHQKHLQAGHHFTSSTTQLLSTLLSAVLLLFSLLD
jgi:hypothetical protein